MGGDDGGRDTAGAWRTGVGSAFGSSTTDALGAGALSTGATEALGTAEGVGTDGAVAVTMGAAVAGAAVVRPKNHAPAPTAPMPSKANTAINTPRDLRGGSATGP